MSTYELTASTLGAPGESLDQVIATFVAAGVRRIEMRAAPDALVNVGLTNAQRAQTRAALEAAGISVMAVASSVAVAATGERGQRAVHDLLAHLDLARDLGAPWVRVFPTAPTQPCPPDEVPVIDGDAQSIELDAARRLAAVAERSAELGVWPLLETHDSHPRGQDSVRILRCLDTLAPGHQVGSIWDLLHPWRTGEDMAETLECLAPYLLGGRGYVQIKDVASRADTTPVLQGSGAVPLARAVDLLHAAGYAGPLSLEWERTWYPQVEPLGEALEAAASALRELA